MSMRPRRADLIQNRVFILGETTIGVSLILVVVLRSHQQRSSECCCFEDAPSDSDPCTKTARRLSPQLCEQRVGQQEDDLRDFIPDYLFHCIR